jgi:hypothetical protein
MWCIPPKQSAEYVFHMEDVLNVYKTAFNPQYPVICIDETFKQLIGETRDPLPAKPGAIERYDHVYTRNGVASLFVAFEPLRSWRTVWVTKRRRRLEWAQFVRSLIHGRYRRAKKLILVMDQLNTHSAASFYEAFKPKEAQWLASKIEIHYTPKHGSWLNMAEIEFSALSRQCLNRRIAKQETLDRQVQAWAKTRNQSKATVDWQFKTKHARIKLKSLYPALHD